MRLCDLSLGDLERRVEASALVPTGVDLFYDVDPETVAGWLEEEASLVGLVEWERGLAGWVDASDVVVADEAMGRAA